MREGIDFNRTFAPVANISNLRVLFALAAKGDWEIKAGDVSTAFLMVEIDAEVYITQPHGFHDGNLRARNVSRKALPSAAF